MSGTEEGSERGGSGGSLDGNGTRKRLWIFAAILALTFVIVLAVAFL